MSLLPLLSRANSAAPFGRIPGGKSLKVVWGQALTSFPWQ